MPAFIQMKAAVTTQTHSSQDAFRGLVFILQEMAVPAAKPLVLLYTHAMKKAFEDEKYGLPKWFIENFDEHMRSEEGVFIRTTSALGTVPMVFINPTFIGLAIRDDKSDEFQLAHATDGD